MPIRHLSEFLIAESRKCCRPAVARFEHPWIAPMPLSEGGAALLRARGVDVSPTIDPTRDATKKTPASSAANHGPLDVFNTGDYSLGLFHHDASEAAIELLRYPEFVQACSGALLNLLDNARTDGFVRRVELVTKSHEDEPSKPVIAQFALRCARAQPGGTGEAASWLRQYDIYHRVAKFLEYIEITYGGMHGLIKAHSALQTGFDNDLLTVALPDNTVEDPGINAFMVLEYEAMVEIARMLGKDHEAPRWHHKAERLKRLMNELMWWETPNGEGFYVALTWKHGVAQLASEIVSDHAGNLISPLCTWVSLLPLYAGVPDAARAAKLVKLMTRESAFWGPYGVRTLPADSVYFNQAPRSLIFDFKVMKRSAVSNWQGPVWVLSNYYMAAGLARAGRVDLAKELTRRTIDLCASGLQKHGSLHECFDDAGKGLWPSEGGFVSWNVLALTMMREWGG
jgi:putative isomerase